MFPLYPRGLHITLLKYTVEVLLELDWQQSFVQHLISFANK